MNGSWNFSDLFIPTYVGKMFKFMVFTFVENALNLWSFLLKPQFSTQNSR